MTLRVPFQDEYLIETIISSNDAKTVLGGTLPDFGVSGSPVGVELDKLVYYLNNHPDLSPKVNTIYTRKSTGDSFKSVGAGKEYRVGNFKLNSTWEFDADAITLGLPFWLLFQNGVSEQSVANRAKRIIPYTSSAIEVYSSIGRNLGPESHILDACIVRNISLSSEEGQTLKASVEFLGAGHRGFDSDVDGSSWNNEATLRTPLLWQNATVILKYNVNSGTKINLSGFNLDLNNNAEAKPDPASQNISKFILGDFEATGSISIPRDTTNYTANSAISDWLDTSNDIGIDRSLLIMWDSIQSGGGDVVLDAAVSEGSTSIVVDGVAGFLVNDIIIIDDGGNNQEFNAITAIDDPTITLAEPLLFSHDIALTVKEAGRDFFGMILNIRFNAVPTVDEDELVSQASFSCVSDGTYKAIFMALVDNVNRSIP